YELDLPNGGRSFVIGNVIEQGLRTENATIIAYGEEGATNPNNELFFINNTVVNNRSNGTFLSIATGVHPALVQNNIFIGTGMRVDQSTARQSHNLNCCGMFVDAGSYDFHLRNEATARDFGSPAGSAFGYSLTPLFQY